MSLTQFNVTDTFAHVVITEGGGLGACSEASRAHKANLIFLLLSTVCAGVGTIGDGKAGDAVEVGEVAEVRGGLARSLLSILSSFFPPNLCTLLRLAFCVPLLFLLNVWGKLLTVDRSNTLVLGESVKLVCDNLASSLTFSFTGAITTILPPSEYCMFFWKLGEVLKLYGLTDKDALFSSSNIEVGAVESSTTDVSAKELVRESDCVDLLSIVKWVFLL